MPTGPPERFYIHTRKPRFISAPLNAFGRMTGAAVLFAVEVYHFVTHVLVLIGWRNLPRRDLVRTR